MSRDPRPIFVGELNPYGADPKMALYPFPVNSAGGRLCRVVLGIERPSEYVRRFRRVNLCAGQWDAEVAEVTALAAYADARSSGGALVLLGSRVARAFGLVFRPFTVEVRPAVDGCCAELRVVQLPHPSGRCRLWNAEGAVARARRALREAGVEC